MLHWYTVHTKPRQENTARENLERQGFVTYAPQVMVRKRRRDNWTKVREPLFPRYLFLQADAEQHSLAPVRSTLGVAGLVRFGQLLRPVPDNVIEYLQALEDPDTHCHDAEQWPHRPGDRVNILEGPFAGLEGIFQAVTGEERAMLLIQLLGRDNTVEVPMDYLSDSQ